MNVYDFDKTIFKYDSSTLFVKYILRKFPRLVLNNTIGIATASIAYLNSKDFSNVKENIFSFLSYIHDIDSIVLDFWKESEQYLQDWYLKQRKSDDIVISASPYFLIEPIAKKYGFQLIATNMDKYSGRIMGCNNKGLEKVYRFREQYGYSIIDEFYSDSLSDQPLADISNSAFLVKGDLLLPWV